MKTKILKDEIFIVINCPLELYRGVFTERKDKKENSFCGGT